MPYVVTGTATARMKIRKVRNYATKKDKFMAYVIIWENDRIKVVNNSYILLYVFNMTNWGV